MFPPVNLRFDVAKLSDSELVERIESAWQTYERIEAKKKSRWDELRNSWNLPIQYPLAYGFLSFLNGPGLGAPLHPSLTLEPTIDMHRTLCEIRALIDELEWRVIRQKETQA